MLCYGRNVRKALLVNLADMNERNSVLCAELRLFGVAAVLLG